MKSINAFCLENSVHYDTIEEAWLDYKVEEKSK